MIKPMFKSNKFKFEKAYQKLLIKYAIPLWKEGWLVTSSHNWIKVKK